MPFIRMILRFIVTMSDKLRPVTAIEITQEQQKAINNVTDDLILYHYPACPFCVKVDRKMRALNMTMDKRDPRIEPFKSELMTGGGEQQVPCLKIGKGDKALWMYESSEIIMYLEDKFEDVVGEGVLNT